MFNISLLIQNYIIYYVNNIILCNKLKFNYVDTVQVDITLVNDIAARNFHPYY